MSLANIPPWDLTAALISALRVTAVKSLALGGVFNSAPENPTYPFVRVIVRGKPIGPIAGSSIWECEAEIDVFSKYGGDHQNFLIANAIQGILLPLAGSGQFPVSGWTSIVMSLQAVTEIPDELLNDIPVKRLTLPVLFLVEANPAAVAETDLTFGGVSFGGVPFGSLAGAPV